MILTADIYEVRYTVVSHWGIYIIFEDIFND